MKYSIQNQEELLLIDENSNRMLYGSDQEWYEKKIQRLAGCGPSTFSNIIFYFLRQNGENKPDKTKKEMLSHMKTIWNYVKPGIMGVNSTEMFSSGVEKYAKDFKLKIETHSMNVNANPEKRPILDEVYAFFKSGIDNDLPIAFLNLDRGDIQVLDSWHWVTIVSIEFINNQIISEVMDGSLKKKIDISKWISSTKKGGGFIRFSIEKEINL